jgi:hypothetical protein
MTASTGRSTALLSTVHSQLLLKTLVGGGAEDRGQRAKISEKRAESRQENAETNNTYTHCS